jgi:copper chaperone CopZ
MTNAITATVENAKAVFTVEINAALQTFKTEDNIFSVF